MVQIQNVFIDEFVRVRRTIAFSSRRLVSPQYFDHFKLSHVEVISNIVTKRTLCAVQPLLLSNSSKTTTVIIK